MSTTIWSILPPLIAIVLALITKEVYLSLLVGVFAGGLLYTNFRIIDAVVTCLDIMGNAVGENMFLIIFLVLLGMIVYLINISGASKAYGAWAARRMKTEKSALLASMLLGALIFIDDYFNCLAVGTIMRPVTDKFKISRVKLAFIIDATAAPICIIAPISSWAAAVGSSLPAESGIDGFALFVRTIPFNSYALLMLAFLLFLIISGTEFGPMKAYNEKVKKVGEEYIAHEENLPSMNHGRVLDLLLPILVLVFLCTFFILYTGGILEGKGIIEAFMDCDSSKGLALGGVFALAFIFIMYIPRKIISFKEFCASFTEGAKAMTAPIFILAFAWTLSGICGADYLDIGGYVDSIVSGNALVGILIPCIMFLVAGGLSFSSGTSWGTFSILIPIVVVIIGSQDLNQLTFVVSAVLAGAIFGDHISPISDTTILSSAGAQCNHIYHVSTQIPYAVIVAISSFTGYLVGGITGYYWAALPAGGVCICIITVFILKKTN